MNPAFARDLSAVFSTADFAVKARVGGCRDVLGILDAGDFETETDFGRDVVRSQAIFTTRSEYGIAEGETLVVNATTYRVRFVLDDGEGVAKLYMERV